MAKNPKRYQVYPRYTPGSPGMVSEEIALTVASQEKESYEQALTGVYGERIKQQAEKEGLQYIVEETRERASGFDVVDLITGQHRRRERQQAKNLRVGDYVVSGRARMLVTELTRGCRHWLNLNGEAGSYSASEVITIERIVSTEI